MCTNLTQEDGDGNLDFYFVISSQDPDDNTIGRDYELSIPFTCRYPSNMAVSTHFHGGAACVTSYITLIPN